MGDAPESRNLEDQEFERLVALFRQDGRIETYVELRRRFPQRDVNVSRLAGIDPLFSLEPELIKAGLNPTLVVGTLDADECYAEELSIQLLERLVKRNRLTADGETHISRRYPGLSDKLIDYLIVFMLEALERNGEPLTPSLLVLLRQRLGGPNPLFHQLHEKREGRHKAVWIGVQLQERGQEPSFNRIAQILGVETSTVSRWFEGEDILREIEQTRRSFSNFPGGLERLRESLGLPPKG